MGDCRISISNELSTPVQDEEHQKCLRLHDIFTGKFSNYCDGSNFILSCTGVVIYVCTFVWWQLVYLTHVDWTATHVDRTVAPIDFWTTKHCKSVYKWIRDQGGHTSGKVHLVLQFSNALEFYLRDMLTSFFGVLSR